MKRLVFLLLVLLPLLLSAQDSTRTKSKFYISAEAGYSFGLGRQFDTYFTNTSAVLDTNVFNYSYTWIVTRVKGGALGRGMFSGLTIGYNAGKLDVGISIQDLQNTPLHYVYTSRNNKGYNEFDNEKIFSASAIRINPFVKIRTIFNERWNAYASLAPSVGLNASIDYIETQENTKEPDWEKEWVYYKGAAWGAITRFGGEYKINENFKAYADLQLAYMQFTPGLGKLVVYTEDGVDKLAPMPAGSREIVFSDEVSYNAVYMQNIDEQGRTILLKQTYNLSSIGLMAGITYNF